MWVNTIFSIPISGHTPGKVHTSLLFNPTSLPVPRSRVSLSTQCSSSNIIPVLVVPRKISPVQNQFKTYYTECDRHHASNQTVSLSVFVLFSKFWEIRGEKSRLFTLLLTANVEGFNFYCLLMYYIFFPTTFYISSDFLFLVIQLIHY